MAPDLVWFGEQIVAEIIEDSGTAMDVVLDATADEVRENTPVLTGVARRSVFAQRQGLQGEVGYGVGYGLFIEIGANGRPGQASIRHAGDTHFGRLPGLIARGGR